MKAPAIRKRAFSVCLCLSDKLKAGMAAFWFWIPSQAHNSAVTLVEKDVAKTQKRPNSRAARKKERKLAGFSSVCREVMQKGKPDAF